MIPAANTVSDCRVTSLGIFLPCIVVSWCPLNWAIMAAQRMAKVVIFTPPAVPADPPPMNMRISVPIKVVGCMDP